MSRTAAEPASTAPRGPRRFRRLKRVLAALAVAIPIVTAGLWYAANTVPWFGAWLADTLRAVIGTDAVARLEEIAYGLEDRWNQLWRGDEKPRHYWDAPSATAPSPTASPTAPSPTAPAPDAGAPPAPLPSAADVPDLPPFRPADVGPVTSHIAAPGDGVWVPVSIPERPAEPALMYKTLLHPDRKRPWAELFVVAIDLRRARLSIVAGTKEPRATAPAGRSYERTGLVPEQDRAALLAAWNGGFKEEHGHYGMHVDGVTLIRPVSFACTIAATGDGSLRIGTWKALASGEASMAWWRQAPPCLVENGKLHPWLTDENTGWGAAIGGDTVVRRSALGLDEAGSTLYMGLSNNTSPQAIAVGMRHAGGFEVAQLDINYSYPRFVLFQRGASGDREAAGLFPGFSFEKGEYIQQPSQRDFFYLSLSARP